MKIKDLEKLKFTTLQWIISSSKQKASYMLGYLGCKADVRKILEEEEKQK